MAERSRGPSASDEYSTLLNELRVLLPGVQVTFSFLLILPFTQRFELLSAAQRNVYLVAYVTAALASVFLTAPSVYHRIRWREVDADVALRRANRLTITGTVFLAIAIASSAYVVTDFLFATPVTAGVTASLGGLQLWFWYGQPLRDRVRGTGSRS